MTQQDPRTAAVSAALAPYAWQSFGAERLACHVVGALDRHEVQRLAGSVTGVHAGGSEVAEAAEAHDERVDVLVEFLAAFPWRALSVGGISHRLVEVLDGWWQRRQWLDVELAWLLEPGS